MTFESFKKTDHQSTKFKKFKNREKTGRADIKNQNKNSFGKAVCKIYTVIEIP